MEKHSTEESWRKFQSGYLLKEKKKDRRRQFLRWLLVATFLCLFVLGAVFFKPFWTIKLFPGKKADDRQDLKAAVSTPAKKTLSPETLSRLVSQTDFIRTDKNLFFIDTVDQVYQVTTSIDIDLQEYIISLLAKAQQRNRGKPQRIAFVVMDAVSGKILAMSGFDLDDPRANPCTASDYPAASIFKIVTAAAAVENLGYTPHTPLYFNGNKYTLYKRQLRDVKNKYTYKTTFSAAFAESVNPIFGKIGKNYLGREKLDAYASAFGFNEQVRGDLVFDSGNYNSEGSDYLLAELGSGFNTRTTISPMFGAMMISAVLNSGTMALPRLVEHVTDTTGEIIYKSEKAAYKKAIKPETAKVMRQLMTRTVAKGTAKKAFRGASRDKILKTVLIGGKTGSLYNKEHTVKYDWFTGFGEDKAGRNKVAVAIVVGHRQYIGTRAATYAKLILKQYFKAPRQTTAKLVQ